MPTENHAKVRILLKNGKAKVVKRRPFTIQLMYETTNYTQKVTLGVDSGSKHIGLSATTKDKVLFESDVELRNDITDKLSTRRELRNSRRHRKTRYRKPRFNNRRKGKGWLAPSVQNKVDTHLTAIRRVHEILPVSKIIVELLRWRPSIFRKSRILPLVAQNISRASRWASGMYASMFFAVMVMNASAAMENQGTRF